MAKKEKLSFEELLEQALVKDEDKPYDVPKNWVWTRLGSVINLYRGVSYTKNDVTDIKDDNNCLILRGGNIQDGKIIFNDNVYVGRHLIKESQFLQANDIIIVASTGSTKVIGKSAVSDSDYSDVAFGAFLMLTRVKDTFNKRFISKFFLSEMYRNGIRELANGVNINNIKNDHIESMSFPLPPLPEQLRIVDLIESIFEKLDRAKELIQNALDSFENRKSAILHKAFKGELTAKWREENKISFYSWKEFKIKDLAISLNQGWSPKCESFPSVDYEKWAVIKTTAIQHLEFIEQENKQLPSSLEPRGKHELKVGDILITRAGPRIRVGVCCLVKQTRPRLLLCDKAYRFRTKEELVIPEYIVLALNTTDLLDEINVMKTGISDSGVNLTQDGFLAIKLNIPTIAEQKEIVRILNNLLENEQKAKELYDVIESIDLMKKSILARAFRGELSTNNPTEEIALELLKDVLAEKN